MRQAFEIGSRSRKNGGISGVSRGKGDASSTPQEKPLKQSNERKLIKNGTISFETNDIEKTRKEIEKLYQEFNGYIASENNFNYGERLQHEQEIRIPSQNFDPFIQKLEQLGTKVENKNISTQDVTEEFIDVEARLKTKKDLEARYRELLKFAKKVDEMLSIENQIGNVRAEIESMEGRLNYLKNQVAFSTLKITYYELTGVDFGFASKFVHSLKNGWDNLLNVPYCNGKRLAFLNVDGNWCCPVYEIQEESSPYVCIKKAFRKF